MKKKIIIAIIVIALIVSSFTTGYFIAKSKYKDNTPNVKEELENSNQEQDNEEQETEEPTEDEPKDEMPTEDEEEKLIPDIISIKYEKETYTTRNKKGVKITESTRNIPEIKFSSNQKAADKIEQSLIEISDNEWNSNIKFTANELKDAEHLESLKDYEGLGATLNFTNHQISKQIITFELLLEGGFGGVGWYGFWGYSYDITTGELLTLKSLTNNYNKLEKILLTEIKKELEKLKREFEIYEMSDQQIIEYINKTGNWVLTEQGISVIFQEYEISDGATGAIKIDIAKSKINNCLKEEYKY